jgi:hypothetical protein
MRSDALRWLLIGVLVLAVIGLLAYARGEPGDDGRTPEPPAASAGPAESAAPGTAVD